MSIIDALEIENKQALEAVQALTAQRDRLRRCVRAEQELWRLARLREIPEGEWETATRELNDAEQDLIDHGDLGEAA